MANLMTIRNESTPQKIATNGGEWHPFRAMRDLLSWDPFRQTEPLPVLVERSFMPDFEVSENKDSYLFKADLPGIKESDVKISIADNRLIISGKRESTAERKDQTYYVCECSYGEFSRSFLLPDGADTEHVKAELKDGVLSLVVPKKAGAQTKQIPIQTGKSKG